MQCVRADCERQPILAAVVPPPCPAFHADCLQCAWSFSKHRVYDHFLFPDGTLAFAGDDFMLQANLGAMGVATDTNCITRACWRLPRILVNPVSPDDSLLRVLCALCGALR